MNTQKESIPITMRNNQLTEGGNLRVWCITQKPQNKKRTWMNDLDEHLKMYINNCKYLA